MALIFAASDSMPSLAPVLRTLSADGTSCESGIIWMFMFFSFSVCSASTMGPRREASLVEARKDGVVLTCGREVNNRVDAAV